MAKTRAQENRAIRQESLREWLSNKCTVQHLVDNIQKIEELDEGEESFTNSLNKLKVANEQRLKIMNKYLPDIKNVEIANDGGGELTIKLVDYTPDHDD
jgi:hypothetical protein